MPPTTVGATLGALAYTSPPGPPPPPAPPAGKKPPPPKNPPPKNPPPAATVPSGVSHLPRHVVETYALNFPKAQGPSGAEAGSAFGPGTPPPSGLASAPPAMMDAAWSNYNPISTPPGQRLGMAIAQMDPRPPELMRVTPAPTPGGPQYWQPGMDALERRVLERLGDGDGSSPASATASISPPASVVASTAAAAAACVTPPLIAALNALQGAEEEAWFAAWRLLGNSGPSDVAFALPPGHRNAGSTALHVAAHRCSV